MAEAKRRLPPTRERRAQLRAEIARYAKRNKYLAHHFADARCKCGSRAFGLELDDTVGAAVRTCARCRAVHPIGDSADFLDDATLDECQCPCGNEVFEITCAVSLYRESDDVRWIYVGCLCTACGLGAVYGDWKNEFCGYRELLARV
jgi:hypothetical protein